MTITPAQRFIAKRGIMLIITLFAIASLASECTDTDKEDYEREWDERQTESAMRATLDYWKLQEAATAWQKVTQTAHASSLTETAIATVLDSIPSPTALAPTNISVTISPSPDPLKITPPTQAGGVSITVTKATPYANNTRVMIEVFVKNLGGEAITITEDQLFVADSNGKLANTQLHIATMVGNAERSVRATSFTVPPNSTVKIFLLAPTTCRPNLHIRYALTATTFAACS